MRKRLDDPDYAAFAWGRFRLVMAWMTTVACACAALAIAWIAAEQGTLGWITMLATFGGVAGSVLMAGVLMGLVFLSSGTGHDEDVTRFDEDRL